MRWLKYWVAVALFCSLWTSLQTQVSRSDPGARNHRPTAQEPAIAVGQELAIAVGQEPAIAVGQEPAIAVGQEPGIAVGQELGIVVGQEPGIAVGQEPGIAATINRLARRVACGCP